MWQTITSAKTSQKQIPALARRIPWIEGQVCLDLGGGRYDLTTEALWQTQGVRNLVVDPYNRSIEHNVRVLAELDARGGADVCMLANVLNVVAESEVRRGILEQAKMYLRPGARLYVSCYAGNGSGVGAPTTKGFQANRPLRSYLDEVREIFPDAKLRGSLIYASR